MVELSSQPQIVVSNVTLDSRFETWVLTMITFIKQVRAELLQVTWPSKQEILRLTLVVIAISAVVGVYLGIVDALLTKLLELIVS